MISSSILTISKSTRNTSVNCSNTLGNTVSMPKQIHANGIEIPLSSSDISRRTSAWQWPTRKLRLSKSGRNLRRLKTYNTWLRQLLQAIHSQLLRNHSSTYSAHKERYHMEFHSGMPFHFRTSQESVHFRSDPYALDSRPTSGHGNRRFWIMLSRPFFPCITRTVNSILSLSIPRPFPVLSWTTMFMTKSYWQLRSIPMLVTLPRGTCIPSWCCHWSQEFGVLCYDEASHTTTTTMVWIPLPV